MSESDRPLHVTPRERSGAFGAVRRKPLQAAKLAAVLLTLAFGVTGFFRLVDFGAVTGSPVLGGGQFLALVFVPLLALGLVLVVVAETLVAGYRLLGADESVAARLRRRPGYLLLRGVEAAVAVGGAALALAALPVLFADATPAPAGVGALLFLLAVGVGILCASLLRSLAELFVYGRRPS